MHIRFWSKVARKGPDDCWLWKGKPNQDGYGWFFPGAGVRGYAHRFAYEFAHGPIPAGMNVCHRCDVPACCNPAHLFLGTQLENIADMKAKGRARGPSWRVGAQVPIAKLDDGKAIEIRRRRLAGEKLRVIAADFDVSEATVSLIARGKIWRHLPPA